MKKRRRILLGVIGIVIVLAAVAAWSLKSRPDKFYRGKTVTAWIRQLSGDEAACTEAKQALIDLGQEGVPFITDELHRTRPSALVNRGPYVFFWEQLVTVEWGSKLRPSLPRPRSHWDMTVRMELFQVLGALGTNSAAAVPQLREATTDTGNKIHHFAIQALGRIGPPAKEALPELSLCLESSDAVARRSAAFALARIGVADAETMQRLKSAAGETNQWVSAFAHLALWKLDPNTVRSQIVSNLVAPSHPRAITDFRSTLISLFPLLDPPAETSIWLHERLNDPTESASVQFSARDALETLQAREQNK